LSFSEQHLLSRLLFVVSVVFIGLWQGCSHFFSMQAMIYLRGGGGGGEGLFLLRPDAGKHAGIGALRRARRRAEEVLMRHVETEMTFWCVDIALERKLQGGGPIFFYVMRSTNTTFAID